MTTLGRTLVGGPTDRSTPVGFGSSLIPPSIRPKTTS
jgi:hypothetical protein